MLALSPAKLVVIAALGALIVPQDSATLKRTYKVDESGAWTMKVNAEVGGGQKLEATADLALKVAKLNDDGSAKATCTMTNLKVSVDGAPMDMMVDPLEAEYNKMGVPDRLLTSEAEFAYTIFAIGSVLPGSDVKKGEGYSINYESKSKASRMSGKGKLVEISEADGVKTATVEYEVDVYPDGEQVPGRAKCKSVIDLATGALISSEGTVSVEGDMELTYSIRRAK